MRSSLTSLPIDSGYGADGRYSIITDSIPHPSWNKHFVYLFHPGELRSPVPVILFCHGIGAENPAVYQQLINHCVSRGFALIYTPFSKSTAMISPFDIYTSIWNGIVRGVESGVSLVDTTRIGIIGHSYGGGAVPFVTFKAVTEKGWGSGGTFMFMMAPWYCHQISDSQLINFPSNVKLVVEIFNDDRVNDHRMAIDIFTTIGIPASEKDFITLYSDSSKDMAMVAGHDVAEGTHRFGWNVNALDYYGVYRSIDALADYTFNNSEKGKQICLGNGSPEQRFMGKWTTGKPVTPADISDTPSVKYPQALFINFWNHAFNARAKTQRFFDSTAILPVSSSTTINNYRSLLTYPKKVNSRLEELDKSAVRTSAENDEPQEYEDDGNKRAELPDSIDDNDLWPIPSIVNGLGSRGTYSVKETFIPHPAGGRGNLYSYTPVDYRGRMPVVFFAPKSDKTGVLYRQLLLYIASNGYKVISSVTRSRNLSSDNDRYNVLLTGFEALLETEKQTIDTNRIGFIGHAYGAGALPALSWHYLKKRHWGSNGTFLFLMSPSYVYCFNDEQFSTFPDNVNMVIEVFEEDHFNDHRIAEDIFYSTNIPPSRKDFLFVRTCAHGPVEYDADFQLPEAEDDDDLEPPLQHGIFRPLHALIVATFDNDSSAYEIALGNGSPAQVNMGKWWDGTPVRPLVSTDIPVFYNIQWAKHLRYAGLSALMSVFYPSIRFCTFEDKINPRYFKIVP